MLSRNIVFAICDASQSRLAGLTSRLILQNHDLMLLNGVESSCIDEMLLMGRNGWMMERATCCESGVYQLVNHVLKPACHKPSADMVVIAGKIVTHLYSTQMI